MTFRRPRLEFDNPTKREALHRANGICECHLVPQLPTFSTGCGRPLGEGNTFYEHITPDGLRPDNSLSNCAALTRTCWKLKSDSFDKPVVAKAKRQADRHHGIKSTPREVLLGTRASNVKKPMNGGPPVYRDSGRQWPAGPKRESDLPQPNGILAGPVAMTGRVPVIQSDPVITRK